MHKFGLLAISFILIFMIVPIAVAVSDVSVGVKQGDWIQYNVFVTGNPPGDHNIKWASMNVTDVQGTAITLDIQTSIQQRNKLSRTHHTQLSYRNFGRRLFHT